VFWKNLSFGKIDPLIMIKKGRFAKSVATLALLLGLFFPYGGWSQAPFNNTVPPLSEEIFVHLSDHVALTGDQLWLAIEVKNHGQPSPSVVVYLDLLDREGNPVKQAMAELIDGEASAYLEIPDQLVSDNYLLRVYTRNSPSSNPETGIYHRILTVINPQSPPSIIAPQAVQPASLSGTEHPSIQTDQESYGMRQPVSLSVALYPSAYFNLSVRQLTPIQEFELQPAEGGLYENSNADHFIPELYGHIIQGKSLASKVDTTETFYLSAHGKQSNLFLTNPLPNGDLFFETGAFRHFDYVIVQSSRSEDQVDFILESPFLPLRPEEGFELPQLQLSETHREYIYNRMLTRESKSYFYSDHSLPMADRPSQFNADKVYLLDDYNRFEDLATTIREYVQEAFVRRRDGKTSFYTANLSYGNLFKNEPLVLLDAMPVFDIDALARLDPKGIKSLEVVARYYYFQKEILEGIISLTSFKGDFGEFDLPKNALFIEYPGIQLPKKINHPRFAPEVDARSPDFRNLLYWEAHGTTDATGRKQISFNTSELIGLFEIHLSYFDEKGTWVEATKTFEVK
jgi:hypothetical protein